MSGHTPGPWRVYEQDIVDKDQAKRELCDLVEGTPDFQPCLVYVTDDDWNLATAVTGCGAKSKANARLIAAAPELLEALKTLISDDVNEGMMFSKRIELARDAIAKAEGREA